VTDTLDRGGILARLAAVPASRIRFLPEADEAAIRGIRYGVFFIVAFWSGPSRMAFRRLTEVLAALDPEARLEFVVADTDGSESLSHLPEFHGKMHGAGETAWVKDGQIVTTSGLGFNPACFEPNTQALLASRHEGR
jgi:hypothetical protein